MKKLYIAFSILFLANMLAAQIYQVTNINKSGDSGIKSPYLYKGVIYFEADNGSEIGDELYMLKANGDYQLFKDINIDSEDTSPNSDPKDFIEFKGNLFFNANDGDNTGHDKELWMTDGTVSNTQMVADIDPRPKKGSNPQQMFVFNDNLYFQANDGSSTQWWKYDGENEPVKVTNLNDGKFATPMNPVIDHEKNWVYFQANNGKNELHIMKQDESIEIIDINPSKHGYNGKDALIYKGKLIFEGDDGTHGDELWISDGTVSGTKMIKDIYADGDEDSNPEKFTIYNDKVYFIAEVATGKQLWVTDGTENGTKKVVETVTGGDGKFENLFMYNDKLYFNATDGTAGLELWVFDGSEAMMLKDINNAGDSKPNDFVEASGFLFFEADAGDGKTLWMTDGTSENTKSVAEITNSTTNPLDINLDDHVIIGDTLFFTGNDDNGDDFFAVNTRKTIQYTVTFNITNNHNQLKGITVKFNGQEELTGADGSVTFDGVYKSNGMDYEITLDEYDTLTGTTTVDKNETVDLSLVKTDVEDIKTSTLKVFPNPTNGMLNITGVKEKSSYQIYDISNKLIQSGLLNNSNKININANAGIYFLRIDGKKTQKVIIK